MRKRFALWLCREFDESITELRMAYDAEVNIRDENDQTLSSLFSRVGDLSNKLAELQRPVEVRQEFHSGRAIPRAFRNERPRQGVSQ